MNAHIKVHEAKEQEAINKAFQQEWMKSSHSWYDKIQSFTQIIVSIGYAGFFATINVCKNYLNPKLLALSSLFMLLSIFVFIINEIIAMKQRDSSMRSAFTVACVEPNKAIETFARFQITEFELSKKRARRASFFFWVSVPAGALRCLEHSRTSSPCCLHQPHYVPGRRSVQWWRAWKTWTLSDLNGFARSWSRLMPLTELTPQEVKPLQAWGLGLGSASSPWDFVAEAWRSALWALCHPHWQATSTQRLSNLFLDLAGPMVGPDGLGEAIQVRDHLLAVGDFIRLPGGEWLPAPLRQVSFGPEYEPQIIGGMPAWVLVELHPRWLVSPGFRRTSRDAVSLPRVSVEDWCDRGFDDLPVRSLQEAVEWCRKAPPSTWHPNQGLEYKNRALKNPEAPPTGAWVQIGSPPDGPSISSTPSNSPPTPASRWASSAAVTGTSLGMRSWMSLR